jgi:hypothetical protein
VDAAFEVTHRDRRQLSVLLQVDFALQVDLETAYHAGEDLEGVADGADRPNQKDMVLL